MYKNHKMKKFISIKQKGAVHLILRYKVLHNPLTLTFQRQLRQSQSVWGSRERPATNRVGWTFQDIEGRVRGWMGGWIFRDWRDDICLVYGKTYARVRTAEVRRSINRPLLKSHLNRDPRVFRTRPRMHAHRMYTNTRAHSNTGPIHEKSSRELFFRLFAKENHEAFIIHCPYRY